MKRKMLETAATEIAADLFGVERDVDASIQKIARMTLTISSTREAAGLSVFHGQDTLEKLAHTFTAMTAARRETCSLHLALDAENKLLGEPIKMVGDAGKPPMLMTSPQLVRAA